jgi:hypothetical protein
VNDYLSAGVSQGSAGGIAVNKIVLGAARHKDVGAPRGLQTSDDLAAEKSSAARNEDTARR